MTQKPLISGLVYTNLLLCFMSVTGEVSLGVFIHPELSAVISFMGMKVVIGMNISGCSVAWQ